jgi:transposase
MLLTTSIKLLTEPDQKKSCGFCSKNNRITQSEFKCKKCKFQINADYNAAINISRKAVIKQNQQNQQRALVNKPIVAKKI